MTGFETYTEELDNIDQILGSDLDAPVVTASDKVKEDLTSIRTSLIELEGKFLSNIANHEIYDLLKRRTRGMISEVEKVLSYGLVE